MKINGGDVHYLKIEGIHATQTVESFVAKINKDFECVSVKAYAHGNGSVVMQIYGGAIEEHFSGSQPFLSRKAHWMGHYAALRDLPNLTEEMYVSELMFEAIKRFGWRFGESLAAEDQPAA